MTEAGSLPAGVSQMWRCISHLALKLAYNLRLRGPAGNMKGTVSRDGYFSLSVGTFSVFADGFQGLSRAFHYPTQYKLFVCFSEITVLTNFENAY
jgi:hypothetical protein